MLINNKKLNEFDNNMSLILDYSLEFENYSDDMGEEPKKLIEIYSSIEKLRQEKDTLDYKTKIKRSKEIINKFQKLIEKVGKEKFKFNSDGSFFYIWNNKK